MIPTEDADVFEDLFLRAPFGYTENDADGIVMRVNDTLLEWIGRTRDEVVGQLFSTLLDPGSRIFFETRHRPALHLNGRVTEVALMLTHSAGSPVPVLCNATVLRSSDGSVRVARTALVQTAARREYERSLLAARRAAETSEARIRVLQQSAADFATAGSQQELAEKLSVLAGESLAARVVVFLVDEAGALRRSAGSELRAGRASSADLAAVLDRPAAEARHADTPLVITSPEEAEARYPDLHAEVREARVGALTATPMPGDGPSLGVMVCVFERPQEFDAAALDLQTALASQAGQVLVRLRLQAELERLALHDQLTGLANRTKLHDEAGLALGRSRDDLLSLAILFFDLDGFKRVNDRFGHQAGDDVLRVVAERTQSAVRSPDLVARFGGDEFVVICENVDERGTEAIAERIRRAVAAPIAGLDISVTASIGAAVCDPETTATKTTEQLFKHADAAMYRSKNEGGDRVTLHIVC